MIKVSHDRFVRIKDVLVVLVIPVLFTLLFGLVYSRIYVENIPIAVLNLDDSAMSDKIIDSFNDSKGIRVMTSVDTEDEMKDLILSGKVKGGLVIPQDFGKELQAQRSPEILVVIDGANMVIGNNLFSYANTAVATLNVGIQAGMLAGGDVAPYQAEKYLSTLSFADRMLYDPQMGYFRYVFGALLGIFIQQTYLSGLIPKLLAEKQRLRLLPATPATRKIAVRYMASEIVRTAMLSIIACLSCLMVAHLAFDYPLRGGLPEVLAILLDFLLCMTAASIMITAFFDDPAHCVQFSMFLSIPTVLTSGYIWPEFMMAPGFAPVIKAIWPLYYFVNPLRDVCMKGADFGDIRSYLAGSLIFAAVWLPVSMWVYRKKIQLMKQVDAQSLQEEGCLPQPTGSALRQM